MSAGFRIFWLTALCFFVAGCASGYRPANLPRTGDPGDLEHDSSKDTIKPGDRVRVTLVDGHEISGLFVSRDLTSLTIAGETSITNAAEFAVKVDTRHTLLFTEIMTVERYHRESNGTAAVVLIGVGVAVFAAVMIGNSIEESLDWDFGGSDW